MQRNKVIYALAQAGLVVNADFNRGGTWAGAVEQLRKYSVPLFVRSTGDPSAGLTALQQRGATPWPEPEDADGVEAVLDHGTPVAGLATDDSSLEKRKPPVRYVVAQREQEELRFDNGPR